MTEQEPTSPSHQASLQTFDLKAAEMAEQATRRILETIPEIRSITVVFDYFGTLNDAEVQRGVWLSRNEKMPPDAICGTLGAMLRTYEEQLYLAYQNLDAVRKATAEALAEHLALLKQHEELLVKAQSDRGNGPPAGGDGPAGESASAGS